MRRRVRTAHAGPTRTLCAAVIAIALLASAGCGARGTASGQSPRTPDATSVGPTSSVVAMPTPLPRTWPDGLDAPRDGTLQSIACLDGNGDGRLDGSDSPRLAGFEVALSPDACRPAAHADYFVSVPDEHARYACGAQPAPLIVVAIASAGSDLLAPKEGESMGLLDIVNGIRADARSAGIATMTVLATPAVLGAAGHAQTSMEHWIEQDLAQRLDALPCLRAVLIGHSHGGVTVTSVMAALESPYPGRLFGVLLDRTTVLYDRPATETPRESPLLNLYQTNEGWHGEPIEQPNVTNLDESRELAPVAPSDGGGGPAPVTHKTLDDAPAVQRIVVSGVMQWAQRDR